MTLLRVRLRGFRNLQPLDLPLSPGVTLFLGPNGAGKTNLLEAVALLTNLISFRPAPPAAWFQMGQQTFLLAGDFQGPTGPFTLQQQGYLLPRFRRQLFRGARRISPSEYLSLCPVTVFSAYDRDLLRGGPEVRRRFLDRLAFHLFPDHLEATGRYRRALAQRNALLASAAPSSTLEAFERQLAHAGALVVARRLAALASLEAALRRELPALGWSLPWPLLSYNALEGFAAHTGEGEQLLLRELRHLRQQERRRGHTLVGPHRHTLRITVQGYPAQELLSAGQLKLLATALRLAAMEVLNQHRGDPTPVLFDDVDAELDGPTLERLLHRLAQGQVLLTSAHTQLLLPQLEEAAVFRLAQGAVQAA